MKEKSIVITSALRTAIGSFNGALINNCKAPVAQLDRALGYGPGGSGFDS